MEPTPEATYERARLLANRALWAIDLQCRRLQVDMPEDQEFVLRKWADFDFLVLALTRLRRAAKLAGELPQCKRTLVPALAAFDSSLPGLKCLRDVAEHVDDYARDSGRDPSVARKSLEISTIAGDGTTLNWLGHELNIHKALDAGQRLLNTIVEAEKCFPPSVQP